METSMFRTSSRELENSLSAAVIRSDVAIRKFEETG